MMLCGAGRVARAAHRHLAAGWMAVAVKAAGGESISVGLSLVCLLLGPGKLPRHLWALGPGSGLGLEPGMHPTCTPQWGLGASPRAAEIGKATMAAVRGWCGTERHPTPCGGCSPGLWVWGRISARVGAEQAVAERGWGMGLPPSLPAARAALAGSCRQRDGTGSGEAGCLASGGRVVGGSIGGQVQGVPFHPSSWGDAAQPPRGPHLFLSLHRDVVEAEGTNTRGFPSSCSAPLATFLRQQVIFTKA